MKYSLLALVLFLSSSISNATSFEQVSQDLTFIHHEFQELAIDLPWDRVYYSFKEKIREQYKEAGRNLLRCISTYGQDPIQTVSLLQSTLQSYRQIGLILPIDEVGREKVNEVVARYMKTEDLLRNTIASLTKTDPTPVTTVWRYNGQAWKVLPNKLGAQAAIEECKKTPEKDSRDWHLPNLREMAQIFREMKDPIYNRAFGKLAQETFNEVWTSDRRLPETDYYFINFKEEKSGTAPATTPFTIVCLGEDLS